MSHPKQPRPAPASGQACDVSIIVVNWNARRVLAACLESLPAAAGALTYEAWLVDNASSDGSLDWVAGAFPWVQAIANGANIGFAAANNQAARLAHGRFLLLLNPDTIVPPGAIEALLGHAQADERIGGLGPRLNNADGSLQRSGWRGFPGVGMALMDALYLWKLPWLPLARDIELGPAALAGPTEVDHVLGACLLIRREAWDQVGGLDDTFFLFLEETDWCFRAKRAGWRIVYEPRAQVTHLGEHSMHQAPERNLPHYYRSYCAFYRKHRSSATGRLASLKAVIALAALLRIALWQYRGAIRSGRERAHARAMRLGYQRVLAGLPAF